MDRSSALSVLGFLTCLASFALAGGRRCCLLRLLFLGLVLLPFPVGIIRARVVECLGAPLRPLLRWLCPSMQKKRAKERESLSTT